MTEDSLLSIFINASLVNNFVLAYFLGLCPFLGVSGKLSTATRTGGAVIFVMLVSSICGYDVQYALAALDAQYLRLISFIAVIASTVQLVEMLTKKLSPPLFRTLGLFLPLITSNCAILGLVLFQTNRAYGFVQSMVVALGAGVAFTLALVLMAGLRERFDLMAVPEVARSAALSLMRAAVLSLAFMGFAGIGA